LPLKRAPTPSAVDRPLKTQGTGESGAAPHRGLLRIQAASAAILTQLGRVQRSALDRYRPRYEAKDAVRELAADLLVRPR
jgi:hypothetical protein